MSTLIVALLRQTFETPAAEALLISQLADARQSGADLAILPEYPLLSRRDDNVALQVDKAVFPASDVEALDGTTVQRFARAARVEAVGILGGALIRDAASGACHSTSLLFDVFGKLAASYRKVHLSPGWEQDRCAAGDTAPSVVDAFAMLLGLQAGADILRPACLQALAASGAEVVLCPRSGDEAPYDHLRTVLIASALVSGAYVVSVPRPLEPAGAERAALHEANSPSIVIAPDGEVLIETTDPMVMVELDQDYVAQVRRKAPPLACDLYAKAWTAAGAGPIVPNRTWVPSIDGGRLT